MIFKARESAKGGSGRQSEEAQNAESLKDRAGSGAGWNAENDAATPDPTGASPNQMTQGMYSRSLKTIQEEANECTENRDPSPHDSDSHTTRRAKHERMKQAELKSKHVADKPLQRASLRNI